MQQQNPGGPRHVQHYRRVVPEGHHDREYRKAEALGSATTQAAVREPHSEKQANRQEFKHPIPKAVRNIVERVCNESFQFKEGTNCLVKIFRTHDNKGKRLTSSPKFRILDFVIGGEALLCKAGASAGIYVIEDMGSIHFKNKTKRIPHQIEVPGSLRNGKDRKARNTGLNDYDYEDVLLTEINKFLASCGQADSSILLSSAQKNEQKDKAVRELIQFHNRTLGRREHLFGSAQHMREAERLHKKITTSDSPQASPEELINRFHLKWDRVNALRELLHLHLEYGVASVDRTDPDLTKKRSVKGGLNSITVVGGPDIVTDIHGYFCRHIPTFEATCPLDTFDLELRAEMRAVTDNEQYVNHTLPFKSYFES